MEDDAQQFIQDLETRFGGTVAYRTYSTWFASNEGIIREYGVFIYVINGVFHFEDFERKPAIFGFAVNPRKKAPRYEKFERSFEAADVQSITVVTKSKATACAEGYLTQQAIEPAYGIDKIFRPLVTRVVLKSGPTYFFELIEHKKFLQALKEE